MMRDRRSLIIVLVVLLLLCCCCAVPGYLWWSGRLDDLIGDYRIPFIDRGEELVVDSGETSIEQQTQTADPDNGLFLPTPTPPDTDVRYIFSPYGYIEVVHDIGFSWILYFMYIYDQDLDPVEGVEVATSLTYPDSSTETQTAMTDSLGMAEFQYQIFEYYDYPFRVEKATFAGFEYEPSFDFAREWTVNVNANEIRHVPTGLFVDYYAGFNQAMASGDTDSLYNNLHPKVIEQYSEEQCLAYLDSVINQPIEVTVNDVPAFGSWDWQVGETAVEIKAAYTLDVNLNLSDGSTVLQETHLALVPGDMPALGWFTYCDANQ
jgi:hypothetical protein